AHLDVAEHLDVFAVIREGAAPTESRARHHALGFLRGVLVLPEHAARLAVAAVLQRGAVAGDQADQKVEQLAATLEAAHALCTRARALEDNAAIAIRLLD